MKKIIKTDLEQLRNKPDSDIDYSDIPETDAQFWENAFVYVPHKKVDLTIKIDDDIAQWLNICGIEYNNVINNILRTYYQLNR